MRIYLAGPMRNIPEFNFPAFAAAAAKLRKQGHMVFSPAERDLVTYGMDLATSNPTGDIVQAAAQKGFSLREALAADTDYICRHADAVALLPGWQYSAGALAEKALADALGLHIIYLEGA